MKKHTAKPATLKSVLKAWDISKKDLAGLKKFLNRKKK